MTIIELSVFLFITAPIGALIGGVVGLFAGTFVKGAALGALLGPPLSFVGIAGYFVVRRKFFVGKAKGDNELSASDQSSCDERHT